MPATVPASPFLKRNVVTPEHVRGDNARGSHHCDRGDNARGQKILGATAPRIFKAFANLAFQDPHDFRELLLRALVVDARRSSRPTVTRSETTGS